MTDAQRIPDTGLIAQDQLRRANPFMPMPAKPLGKLPNLSTFYPSTLSVCKGTITASFQSLGVYSVATDFGTFYCQGNGSNGGQLGAVESLGRHVGDMVFVAIDPKQPSTFFRNQIIGSVNLPIAGAAEDIVRSYATYPSLVGFREEAGENGASTAGFTADCYQSAGLVTNTNAGLRDGLDGDWSRTSMFGAGVGVEAFQAWVRGSPMAGIFFLSDDHTTKLQGLSYFFDSMSREYFDKLYGATMVEVDKRVQYPVDSLLENQPQGLRVNGPIHGGDQTFYTYREKDNLFGGEPFNGQNESNAVSRIALFHEYRGIDGSYVMTSAANIIFQRYIGLRVPIHIVTPPGYIPPTGKFADFPNLNTRGIPDSNTMLLPDAAIPAAPADDPATIQTALETVRVFNRDGNTVLGALAGAATGVAKALIDWQARNGFDKLPAEWKILDRLPPGLSDNDVPQYGAAMWGCYPTSLSTVQFNLDPYNANKKYILGRSIIGILEDGSLVMQGPDGASVTISGGNIYLTAPKDVIVYAGRNQLYWAGRDTGIKSGRHIEVANNEGHVAIKATGQLAMSGGSDRYAGVLIESKGDGGKTVTADKYPEAGGVVIKSQGTIAASGSDVFVSAGTSGTKGTGCLFLRSSDSTFIESQGSKVQVALGSSMYVRDGNGTVSIGGISQFLRVTVDRMEYKKLYTYEPYSRGEADANSYTTALYNRINTGWDRLSNFYSYYDADDAENALKFKFLNSADYTVPSSIFFTLPKPGWQSSLEDSLSADSVVRHTIWREVTIQGTAAYPGIERLQDGTGMSYVKIVPEGDSFVVKSFTTTIDGVLLKGV